MPRPRKRTAAGGTLSSTHFETNGAHSGQVQEPEMTYLESLRELIIAEFKLNKYELNAMCQDIKCLE